MKKKKAALLAAALGFSLLAGCGQTKKTEQTASAESSAASASKEEAEPAADSGEAFTDQEPENDFTSGESQAEEENTAISVIGDKVNTAADDGIPIAQGIALDPSSPLSGLHKAQIEVEDYGTISLELDADTAPLSVTNFVKLAQEGFYDGLTFHRIIKGFMIQGGDPLGNGTGSSDDTVKGEFSENGVENDISHKRGVISMARSMDPDSASCQFFIVHEDSDFLDGKYAAFGHVTEGMDVVDKICEDANPSDDNGTIPKEEQPVIKSITIQE